MKYAAMASTVLATIFAPFFAPSFASTTTAGTIRLDEAAEARAGLRTEAIDEKSFGDEVRLVGQGHGAAEEAEEVPSAGEEEGRTQVPHAVGLS